MGHIVVPIFQPRISIALGLRIRILFLHIIAKYEFYIQLRNTLVDMRNTLKKMKKTRLKRLLMT